MALLLEINGVDRGAYWFHDRDWRVEKTGSLATFQAVLCDVDSTAAAFRPAPGDVVRLTFGVVLLFGGLVVEVRDERLLDNEGSDEAGTATVITCRDFNVLAEEIVVTEDLASGDVLAIVASLVSTYLAPKGVTNIGATSGGPTIPAISADHQTLSAVLEQCATLSGYRYLLNGDKQFACFAPGSLVFSTGLDESNTRGVLVWSQSRAEYATRLFIRTGGSGVVTHSETHTGDGTKTVFLLNVEPQIVREETTPGTVTKTVQAPTSVTENSTSYPIGGGRWTYDADLHAVVKVAAGPLPAGHTVTAQYAVEFPAWVRVWDPVALEADGSWDLATCIDRVLQVSNILDLAQCAAWGREELSRRGEQPKIVDFITEAGNLYPFLEVSLTYPPRLLSGDYLIEQVVVTPGIEGDPVFAAQALEGDVRGRSWPEYYRDRQAQSASGGAAVIGSSSGGGTSVSSAAPIRYYLGGDNQLGDRATTWTDVPNAVPMRLGGAGMSGTWTLRVTRRVTKVTSPTTSVEVRLATADGSSVLATLSGTSSTTWQVGTQTFTMPLTEGLYLLQYRVNGGGADPAEARIGNSTLERD